ncbi:DUF86 domain-containing protein [uncultured Adlercreutzia sp.]|uniref:HepT-like ribonuclease domain-containing protein n=1 Tax=uncultured Adlercreutzia sp. TaxID=875803 RepID=UPI0026F3E786|nr:HepT-like ribonuclease domain-containing protein [uncultured Adlercreutzia sp.]
MSAKPNDALRIQEMYDVATQTLAQFEDLGLTEERFLNPTSAQEDLVADGLVNRVLRVTEEGGKLSEELAEYGFEMREMSALRNRIAHAYGTVDKAIVWQVLVEEFPALVESCERYCEDQGLYLLKTWEEEASDDE